MNKYVVAFISFHDNELKQEVVEAESPILAAISYLGWTDQEFYDAGVSTIKELKNFLFEQDATISVLDLQPKYRINPPRPWAHHNPAIADVKLKH